MNRLNRSWTEADLWPHPLTHPLPPVTLVTVHVPQRQVVPLPASRVAAPKGSDFSNAIEMLAMTPALPVVEIAAKSITAAGCIRAGSTVGMVAETAVTLDVIPAAAENMATSTENTANAAVTAMGMAISAPAAT